MSMSASSQSPQPSSFPQGILFKRRDVFRKIWRPRWFVLETDGTAVMTYHLLCTDIGSHHHINEETPMEMQSGVDYDVAPRGTIYLAGCEIEANDRLTRPEENLYVFTITPPADADSGPCFLATTTLESRDDWIQKLASVCEETEEIASVDGTEHGSISDHPSQEEKEPAWTNLVPPSRVLTGVPRRLAQGIENALVCYLPLCGKAREWKLFLEKDGVSAYERRYNRCSMIKTVASLPFPAKQVFSLLIDCKRRQDYETNVRYDERLKQFSCHTFLDYYAYQAVWPTLARDFGVVLHWRVLCRGGGENESERAICMLAFSDDAADELRPPASDHVRADLKVSLYLIQPTGDDSNHCQVTRILSYDLCGNVPKSLTNKVVQQQATMPLIITQHLTETEPNPPTWLTESELDNDIVRRDVIEKLAERGEEANGMKRLPKFADRGDSLLLEEDSSTAYDETMREISLPLTAVLLLTPLILWSFADSLDLPGKEAYFLLASVLAVRAVALCNIGVPYEGGGAQPSVGKVTCRFSVDLKGVLRFIANRKEEQQQEEQVQSTEVSVIHIVIGAIAVAMGETEPLKCRRFYNPLIGIDGYYASQRRGVDISLLVPSSDEGKQDDIYTLNGIGSMSVQRIADRIVEEQDRMNEANGVEALFTPVVRFLERLASVAGLPCQPALGTCLVVASPDHSDHSEVDVDVSPLMGSGVNVVVVVGGVRLVRDTKPSAVPGRPTSASIKTPPRPTLSMSITIDCPICSVAASRRFAERIQQLVQFPEMCED